MMAKPIFEILLFLCSSLLLSFLSVAVASPYPTYALQKTSNCQDRCGNISFPYPFGIGANCFLNEWYEILCKNDIPSLNKLGLEVLNITLPLNQYFGTSSTITVSHAIVYSDASCAPAPYRNPLLETFYGSPFHFSSDYNIFVVVGCVKFAMLTGSNNSYVGCSTECSRSNTSRYSSCDGFDCCQSTLPPGLKSLSNKLKENNSSGASGGDKDCHFVFLVNSTWFEPNSTNLCAIHHGGYVLAVLGCGILDATFPTLIGLKNICSWSYSERAPSR